MVTKLLLIFFLIRTIKHGGCVQMDMSGKLLLHAEIEEAVVHIALAIERFNFAIFRQLVTGKLFRFRLFIMDF